MRAFSKLLSDLDSTNSSKEKQQLLAEYMQIANCKSAAIGIYLLLGNKTDRLIGTKELKALACSHLNIAEWLFEESYQSVGDLAETISLLFPHNQSSIDQSLEQLMLKILALTDAQLADKEKFILEILTSSDFWQRFSFLKILTGGFRLGVAKNIVIKACAKRFEISDSAAAAILTGSWNPSEQNLEQIFSVKEKIQDLSRPYPFLLAYALESDFKKLAECNQYLAEYKWDGIRAQLIKRQDKIYLWSRGEELINSSFPDILAAHQNLPSGTVLDGEILAYDQRPLVFSELQRRLGRANPSVNLQKQCPCIFMAYDILEFDCKDIRDNSLEQRKALLESIQDLKTSKSYFFDSWEQAFDLRSKASELKAEGLMLKRMDSFYASGRKKGLWLKWKLDPFSVDAVLVYAQKGHGRRANLYSDYTFAIWKDQQLVTFAKAYSGLTDQEILEVDSFVKRNTKEKFGPVRTVKPELVFELAFEGIQPSNRHKSGLAVRFPRIVRWRKDKQADQADKIEDLLKLIAK